MSHTYKEIVSKAKSIKNHVEKEYKIGEYNSWVYYIAKAILTPNTTIKEFKITSPKETEVSYISNQIFKSHYMDCAERLVTYVEKHKQLPSYITWKTYKIGFKDYTYLFSRILAYYDTNKAYPKYANINSKAFTRPTETTNTVYDYFIKTFGKITCIDDALDKISGRGYGYYYDDQYSNQQSIDRMKKGLGVNCTDSCQVFYNLGLVFVRQGKYKKVECLHVKCQGGDGHVRLRFTLPNGEQFYRDPACTLDNGGYCNWCMNGTLLAINPSWFMQNLNR